MTSIRLRLFVLLVIATGTIWLSAVGWLQYSTRAQIERVLDSRLAEAGHMVSSLLSDQRLAQAVALDREDSLDLPDFQMFDGEIARNLHCQVWSLRGTLLGQSGGGPNARLAEAQSGFSTTQTETGKWRVYTVVNEAMGVEIVVGESMSMRENLLADVRSGLLWPILVILPLLAGAIWVSSGRGLMPLQNFATALGARDEGDLSPVAAGTLPVEIRPLQGALNDLLGRLNGARKRERDFIAYAAHELKTPLAGIRAQAQVAQSAQNDGPVQQQALTRLIGAVDRSARLVAQLLDLARAQEDAPLRPGMASLDMIVAQSVGALSERARRAGVALVITGTASDACADQVHLSLALRNVVENAIDAAPRDTAVTIKLSGDLIEVHDDGRGISSDDLPFVTDRFFTGKEGKGTGLGLAIAEAALNRIGWRLDIPVSARSGQNVRLSRG